MDEMTIFDIITLALENYDAVEVVWQEMPEETTMMEATIEWAKRNGREIKVVASK